MTLKSAFNKCLASFGLTLFLILFGGTVAAQQQTQQIAPPTRNPQTNLGKVFQQQQSSVQSTGSEQLLRQNSEIEIPQGEAARTDQTEEEFSLSPGAWIGLMLLGAAIATITIFRSNRTQIFSPFAAEPTSDPIETKPKPLPNGGTSAKSASKPKKKSKTNKARKRHKRKRN